MGIVIIENKLEISAMPAPISQFFPTSLGNTTVLSPQGKIYTNKIGIINSLGKTNQRAVAIIKGMIISLKRANI